MDLYNASFILLRDLSIFIGVDFYLDYALRFGFGVRHGCKRKKDELILLKYLLCKKQGFRDAMEKKRIHIRMSGKVGCIARFTLHLAGSDGYKVVVFEEHHNHKLVDKIL
ncbi:hypothetical protein V2J09_004057 [Rumex salicifolius]